MLNWLWRSGNLLLLGFRALARNKLRTSLTTLGLVIGVGCVIVVIAIGRGASAQIEEAISTVGSNVMFVVPGFTQRNGIRLAQNSTLTLDDVDAIRTECPSVSYASPQRGVNVQIIIRESNWGCQIRGVGTDFPLIRVWNPREGHFFTDSEVRTGAKVCVLGATVADNLFPNGGAVGETVRVRNVLFKIVGVLERKGADPLGSDQDDIAFAPFKTVATRLAGDIHPN